MKTNRAINGIIREMLWLGEILHHEGLFGGSQSKAGPSSLLFLQSLGINRTFHHHPLSLGIIRKSVFGAKRCSNGITGKGSEAAKEYLCACSFLERGLGLGMAPIPEFSWKFYLLLNHDPSLKLIEIFSISAFVSCWRCWVLGEHLELQGQVRMELPSTELAEQGAMLSITSSSS